MNPRIPSNSLRLDHVLMAAMMAGMVIVAFLNVMGRYVFGYSLAFTEEITVNLFVGVVVVGTGLAFERGLHLGVTVLARRFALPVQNALRWIAACLGTALFALLDVLLIRECYFEIRVFQARSAGLNVPVWIYYAAVVLLSPFVFRGLWRGARSDTPSAAGEPKL